MHNVELFDYQASLVDDAESAVHDARTAFANPRRQVYTAVGLVSPTGTGKTMMATALLERLVDAEPDLCVLWICDNPELNKQSAAKILSTSDFFTPDSIRFLGEMDQPRLDAGAITFAHIQMLGRGARSMHAETIRDGRIETNDARTYGVWDILINTVRHHGRNLLVVIDEAHSAIGTTEKERSTIIATLVHGGTTPTGQSVPPAPVVLGMSATPDRFIDSMTANGSNRRLDIVQADLERVIASGILKKRIYLPKVDEKQDASHTLLAQAVAALRNSTDQWATYSAATGAPLVEPCLVVQVKAKVTDTELSQILDTLQEAWSDLSGIAIAHCFDTHSFVTLKDERSIRYIEPTEVARSSSRVKAVLFKDALTTGWDCPRAEVMVSMKSAASPTVIAQMVGRMVRSPLAREIKDSDTDETIDVDTLNSVTMYVPHYDKKELAKVVAKLSGPDGETPGTEVSLSPVTLTRSTRVPGDVFELIANLPSVSRPSREFKDDATRARSLASALIDDDLTTQADAELDSAFRSALTHLEAGNVDELDAAVDDILTIDMRAGVIELGADGYAASRDSRVSTAQTAERDLQHQFMRARKSLPDNSADLYDKTLSGDDDREDRARVIALARHPEAAASVQQAAREQIDAWRKTYSSKVARAGKAAVAKYTALWSATHGVIDTTVEVPDELVKQPRQKVVKVDGEPSIVDLPTAPKHLFVLPDTDQYPVKHGSGWEEKVLTQELDHSPMGWYRNPSSGAKALSVPYEMGDQTLLMHPDFLFVREDDGHLVVDAIDPHLHSQSDTGPKWLGLARWADKHSGASWLGRVVAVVESGGSLRALDLRDSKVRAALHDVTDKAGVEAVFAEHGVNY